MWGQESIYIRYTGKLRVTEIVKMGRNREGIMGRTVSSKIIGQKKVMQNILDHVNINRSGRGRISVTHECIELIVEFFSCLGFLGTARGSSAVGTSRGAVANGSSCESSSGWRNKGSLRIKSKTGGMDIRS